MIMIISFITINTVIQGLKKENKTNLFAPKRKRKQIHESHDRSRRTAGWNLAYVWLIAP